MGSMIWQKFFLQKYAENFSDHNTVQKIRLKISRYREIVKNRNDFTQLLLLFFFF